ncbi:MAG TPA: MaoC family dehydratase [Candidatus Binataceae bacterium]|nr:MaoC family dehydratase [Candidatus Binataceae bacterium]
MSKSKSIEKLASDHSAEEGKADVMGPLFYIVSPEQVESFSEAIGSQNPLFTAASPLGVQFAPPTMRLRDYALLQRKFGGSVPSMKGAGIHTRQRTEFHSPLYVGQAVKASGRLRATYIEKGRQCGDIEYEMRDAYSDRLLERHIITYTWIGPKGESK